MARLSYALSSNSRIIRTYERGVHSKFCMCMCVEVYLCDTSEREVGYSVWRFQGVEVVEYPMDGWGRFQS